MNRFKQIWILIFVAVAVLCVVCAQVIMYYEKQDCICARLTDEQQTFEIDDHLRSYLDNLDETSGTWTERREMCRHHKHILLRIFPDEGIYKGNILD